jgi:hypothetical protein
MHRKYNKRLNLGGGLIYDRSSAQALVIKQDRTDKAQAAVKGLK